MTWIYNQVKYTSDDFSPIVFTQATRYLDQFPWEPIYSNSDKNNHIIFRALRKFGILSRYPVFDAAIKRHQPRILHSHFGDRGWADLPVVKKYGLKHVVTFYGYDVSMLPTQEPVWKERYNELFNRADLFLCEGPHMAKCLVKLGCPDGKVKVQRLSVDPDKIHFVARKIAQDGLIKILIASTFREKKGIPYALEAIGILKNKYSNIRVTLIGDDSKEGRDKQEKKKIIAVIRRYKLESITRMLGFQPHKVLLKEAYSHHIFVAPSVTAADGDTEGGAPVVITEMAASGMPVISTYHCDIPEVVLNNQTGFLVRERNIQELSIALEKIIRNPNLLKEFGLNARKHIVNKFNITECSKSLKKYYASLL